MHDLKMTDQKSYGFGKEWKMTDKNYGVWKMQDWKNDGQTFSKL